MVKIKYRYSHGQSSNRIKWLLLRLAKTNAVSPTCKITHFCICGIFQSLFQLWLQSNLLLFWDPSWSRFWSKFFPYKDTDIQFEKKKHSELPLPFDWGSCYLSSPQWRALSLLDLHAPEPVSLGDWAKQCDQMDLLDFSWSDHVDGGQLGALHSETYTKTIHSICCIKLSIQFRFSKTLYADTPEYLIICVIQISLFSFVNCAVM